MSSLYNRNNRTLPVRHPLILRNSISFSLLFILPANLLLQISTNLHHTSTTLVTIKNCRRRRKEIKKKEASKESVPDYYRRVETSKYSSLFQSAFCFFPVSVIWIDQCGYERSHESEELWNNLLSTPSWCWVHNALIRCDQIWSFAMMLEMRQRQSSNICSVSLLHPSNIWFNSRHITFDLNSSLPRFPWCQIKRMIKNHRTVNPLCKHSSLKIVGVFIGSSELL